RLARFCTATGVEPDQVAQSVLLPFYEALKAEERVKDPRVILSLVMSSWNHYARDIPDWPQVRLTSPFPKREQKLDVGEFPIPFQAELAEWRREMAEPDVLDADAAQKAIRPVTVAWHVNSVIRFASDLVKAGELPLEKIISLDVLLRPEILKKGLRLV